MKKLFCMYLLSLCAVASLVSCGGGGSGAAPAATASADCGKPGSRCTGTAGGLNYILYVPANFKANTGSLVMTLHPRTASGVYMENLTRLNAKADQAGFAVLYPETFIRQWGWFFKDDYDSGHCGLSSRLSRRC